jgi:two-component system phosphate regulon response regulator PhoB
MQPRILIVEDEHDLGQALVYYLKNEGFHADLETTAAGGLRAMDHEELPDLVLVDWMLPDSPGTELCRQLKSADRTRRVPIVMISARGEEIDRVVGFELGAEDYLVKPFSLRELTLRIRAILRYTRAPAMSPAVRQVQGVLEVDPSAFSARVSGSEVALTVLEMRLLLALLGQAGRVYTRDQLVDEVWGNTDTVTVRAVDSHVKRLRKKLGDASGYIEAVRGVGYRFRAVG